MDNCLIEAVELRKTYGEGEGTTVALNGVSLKIYEGEFVVILGPSGCGKSTFMNIIAGVDKADSGDIICSGNNIAEYNSRQLTKYRSDYIGYVFQSFNLLEDLTVYSNVVVSPGANKNRKDVEALLEGVGLLEKKNRHPKQLSGGEQQRVSIARALNKSCKVLICDEPTGALDYNSGKAVLGLLEKINLEQKKTIVMVTHTKEISRMASRIITMKNGQITSDVINNDRISSAEVDW